MSYGIWDKIREGMKETLNISIEKTEELTKISKIKFDILMLKRTIKNELARLGSIVYEKQKQEMLNGIFELEEFNEYIGKVKELERELHQKEDNLEFINLEKKETQKRSNNENDAKNEMKKLQEENERLEKELKSKKNTGQDSETAE